MFVSKKHFKKLTKKSLFLLIEKRKRSCSSATKKRNWSNNIRRHFFIIYCHTSVSIGNRGKVASLVSFLSPALLGIWSFWSLFNCLVCIDGLQTSQITLVSWSGDTLSLSLRSFSISCSVPPVFRRVDGDTNAEFEALVANGMIGDASWWISSCNKQWITKTKPQSSNGINWALSVTYVRFSHLYTFLLLLSHYYYYYCYYYLFIYLFICTGCNPTDSGVRMVSFAVNERNMRKEKRNPVVPVSTISILKKLDRT